MSWRPGLVASVSDCIAPSLHTSTLGAPKMDMKPAYPVEGDGKFTEALIIGDDDAADRLIRGGNGGVPSV